MSTDTTTRAEAMAEGRRADSSRRRERVLAALAEATIEGQAINVSEIARRAGVDRTFLYRHRDLLVQLHTLETLPPNSPPSSTVTRASVVGQFDFGACRSSPTSVHPPPHMTEGAPKDSLCQQPGPSPDPH